MSALPLRRCFILGLVIVLPACTHKAYDFTYELRVPESAPLGTQFCFEVASTRGGCEGSEINPQVVRREGGYKIFSREALLQDGEGSRAVIVEFHGRPAEVFLLPVKSNPEPTEWTDWRKPDYLQPSEHEDATWHFMYRQAGNRSYEIPGLF